MTTRDVANAAFSGEGAKLYGGRWNSAGTALVYTSETLALSLLEILVNASNRDWATYVYFEAEVPDTLVVELSRRQLPARWDASPVPIEAQMIGDAWVRSGSSVGLWVPSAVLPTGEGNVLLNPGHPDFTKVKFGKARSIDVDDRVAGALAATVRVKAS